MIRDLADRLRRAARLAVGRSLRFATSCLRPVARTAIRLRPGLEPRLTEWAWLWQPGWGRGCHERLYRRADPYGVATSSYEQAKYDLIIQTLHEVGVAGSAGRVFEVGCAEGLLTTRLADHADDLVAVDISDGAVRRARRRLADRPHVVVERRTLPFDMPEGTFDLIVCSDVLYYWESRTLRLGFDRLLDRLRPGGRLLLLHYRGDFGQAGTGDAVHDLARTRAASDDLLVHELTSTLDGAGPGGAGIRLDVLTFAPKTRPDVCTARHSYKSTGPRTTSS